MPPAVVSKIAYRPSPTHLSRHPVHACLLDRLPSPSPSQLTSAYVPMECSKEHLTGKAKALATLQTSGFPQVMTVSPRLFPSPSTGALLLLCLRLTVLQSALWGLSGASFLQLVSNLGILPPSIYPLFLSFKFMASFSSIVDVIVVGGGGGSGSVCS